jgi:glycosyltransferase involved in cell wall biosynthesis
VSGLLSGFFAIDESTTGRIYFMQDFNELVQKADRGTIDNLFKEVRPRFRYTIFSNVDDETLAKLYSSFDVFMFTSCRKGFGLPQLEAMASCTAVAIMDCGGVRDYAVDGYDSQVTQP